MKVTGILWLACICMQLRAQQVQMLAGGNNTALRGLSVVSDQVIWVSGSHGTVGKSLDGGATWKWITVSHFENRDFRDIEAFDGATAIIMAVSEPACLLKTVNGGDTWKVVYSNATPGMFLDAMEFWNPQSGIVIGDPVNGRFFIARTFDEGNTWRQIPYDRLPVADTGEACFASSGTNIRQLSKSEACFVSGGISARLFTKGTPVKIPVIQGSQSTGANSIAVREDKQAARNRYLVVVGGDFAADTSSSGNCAITSNGGKSWTVPRTPPHGYRSCVEFIAKNTLVACGTTGVDITTDAGLNWQLLSTESFHVCRKAKTGTAVFLAGRNGRIAKLNGLEK